MRKTRPGTIRRPGKLSSKFMEDLQEEMERSRQEEEKRKKREKRSRHRAFIRSGVKAGFTVKQVLWIIKHFSSVSHQHWDGRLD